MTEIEEVDKELEPPNTDILDAEVEEASPDFNIKPSLQDK